MKLKTTISTTSTFTACPSSASPHKQLKKHSKCCSVLNKLAMLCLLVFNFLLISSNPAFAADPVTLQTVDFESDGSGYTVSPSESNANANAPDYWIRTNGTIPAIFSTNTFITSNGSFFFAAEDLDYDLGATAHTVTCDEVSVSGYSSLQIKLLAGGKSVTSTIEGEEYLKIQYNMDGGGWVTRAQFIGDGRPNYFEDENADGIIDGAAINETLSEFTYSIPVTGTTLQVRINIYNGGSEELAVDDIRVVGTVSGSTPTVTNASASSINLTSATLGGNVTADGGAAVSERGVVYSTSDSTPTIGEGGVTKDTNGTGSGIFTEAIGSLEPGTTYYYNAYATNSVGTSYGAASSFTTLSPEIAISGNNVQIADGDTTPATADHSDFGSIAHDEAPVVRTFTIQNFGSATLTLGSNAVSISGTNAADFTITSQPATTVAAGGGSTTFQISFSPSALGLRSAAITIANDDSDESPYNFAIAGTQINSPPYITVDNSTLAYNEDDAAMQIDAAATVADVDGDGDWDGGTLDVQITANAEAADEITIADNVVGSINTNGTNIRNASTVIGSLSASEGTVTNGTKLIITFNSNATNVLVQQVLKAIHYRNTSNDPGTSNRTITITANDKNAASASDTRTVSVISLDNDAPTIAINNTLNINEGATSTISAVSHLSASDVDDDDTTLVFTVTTNTSNGALKKSGTIMNQDETFTQADLTAGNITYVHDGSNAVSDSFIFKVSDDNSNELTNQTFSFAVTTRTQFALLDVPNTNSIDNSALDIDFTLPEAASPGTVKMTFIRTAGSADENAPHILTFAAGFETAAQHTTTLDGTDLSANANVASVTTDGNDALADGTIYTVKLEYQDEVLNTAAQTLSLNFTYENITQLPTLSSPATGSIDNASLPIDFTLPEAATSGTVKMTFIQTGGTADPNAPHVLTFAAGFETAAQHTTTLDGLDLSNNANVSSVSTGENDALVDGATYSVKLEYQDAFGNSSSSATNTGFTYDQATEVPILSSPALSSSDNSELDIGFTLPEAASPGTVKMTFIRIGGNADPMAPHTLTFAAGFETAAQHTTILNGTDLSSNANVSSVNTDGGDLLVNGAIYSVKLEYQDTIGNPTASVTNTAFTYDLNYAPTITTQAVTSISTTSATGHGNITDLGVPSPTQHGICWNTSGSPTTADSSTAEGVASATGAFTSDISGLTAATTYYVRAYVTNSKGTSYGSQVSFTTDEPSIAFNTTNSNSSEAFSSTDLQVDLSALSSSTVSVDYTVSGTATGSGSDYTLADGTLTITPGNANNNITIASIVDDVLDENNETVIVTLSNPTNATLGTNTVHTYTIEDNDAAPTVTFTSASQASVGESGLLTITATLSAVSGLDVTVPFTVNAGSSATSNSDYTITNSPLTIAAGSTTATITVNIVTDLIDEGNESIIIDMGAPLNVTHGATNSHTATITDDDVAGFTIAQTAGSTQVSESATTDTFTVVLTTQPTSDVVFTIISDDTAEATVNRATLTFNAANWNIPQPISVIGVNDDLADGSQISTITITVNDAASDNAFDTLTSKTVTVTTTDNDNAGFILSESDDSTEVSEFATTDTLSLVLTAQPTSNVVLTVNCLDSSELVASPALITFTPANAHIAQTVTVTGVDDDLIDGIQITTVSVSVDDATSADAFDPLADQSISALTRDNDAPIEVANAISDVAVVEGSANSVINLSTTFENPNDSNAAMVKSVTSNSNAALVIASISSDTLTLAYQADQVGTATITVRGTSNDKHVDDSFTVTVQALQEATFEKIQDYATNSDASLLTVAELITAGVVEVEAANLAAYKEIISAQSAITDLATLQTLIYQVNALEQIKLYALNSDASPLTIDELIAAGVVGALADHLGLYQQEIAALDVLADLAALQTLIDQVHALVTIQGYVEQSNAAEMKLAELQLTGTEDLYYYNLPAYRLAVEITAAIDSLQALQELITATNLASAVDQGAAPVTLPEIVDEDAMLNQLKEEAGFTLPVTDDDGDEQQVELHSQLPTPETVDQDSEEGRVTWTNSFAGAQLSTVVDEQGFVEQQVQTADGSEGGVASMWLDILAQTTAGGVMTLQATIPYTDSDGVTTPLAITTTLQPTGLLRAEVQRTPAVGEATTSTLASGGANGGAVVQADGSLLMMLETALSGNPISSTGHVDSAGRVDGVVVQGGVETTVNSLLPGSDVTVLSDGRLQLRSVQVVDFAAADVHGDQYNDLFYVDNSDHRVLYANADITTQGMLWTGYTIVRNGLLEQQYDTLATTPDDGFNNRFPAQASASITTDDNGDPCLVITTTLELPLQF